MRFKSASCAVLALLCASPLSAAPRLNVATFLARAQALERKGPLAIFSGDLKLLTNQVKADFAEIRQERLAAKAAGKPTGFCPPEKGVKLSDKDIMAAMQAVPVADRARTDTKSALRVLLVRRYPCRN